MAVQPGVSVVKIVVAIEQVTIGCLEFEFLNVIIQYRNFSKSIQYNISFEKPEYLFRCSKFKEPQIYKKKKSVINSNTGLDFENLDINSSNLKPPHVVVEGKKVSTMCIFSIQISTNKFFDMFKHLTQLATTTICTTQTSS